MDQYAAILVFYGRVRIHPIEVAREYVEQGYGSVMLKEDVPCSLLHIVEEVYEDGETDPHRVLAEAERRYRFGLAVEKALLYPLPRAQSVPRPIGP